MMETMAVGVRSRVGSVMVTARERAWMKKVARE